MIRCSRQRNSSLSRRESRKGEEKSEVEKGGRRALRRRSALRPGLEGELKIVPDYERVAGSIAILSIYRVDETTKGAREKGRERERERGEKGRTSRKGPRLSKAEWNHLTPVQDTSRSVLFPEVAPSDGQLWMLKIQLRGIYGCRRWAYLLSYYPLL